MILYITCHIFQYVKNTKNLKARRDLKGYLVKLYPEERSSKKNLHPIHFGSIFYMKISGSYDQIPWTRILGDRLRCLYVHYFLGTMMPSGLRIEFLISPITQSRDS
jgi:hypothetical protein